MSRKNKTRRRAKRNARALARKQEFTRRYTTTEGKDKPDLDFSKSDFEAGKEVKP